MLLLIAAALLAPAAQADSIAQVGSFTDDLMVSAPTELSPADGATRSYPTQPLQFSWMAVAGTSGYEVQISLQQNSTSSCTAADAFSPDRIAVNVVVNDNSYVPTLLDAETAKLWTGVYCWRVRASTNGVGGWWSSHYRFTRTWSSTPTGLAFYNDTSLPIPRAAGSAADTSTKVAGYISWNEVSGASAYDVQVASSPSFAQAGIMLSRDNVKGAQMPLLHLPDDTYYWRVRAISPNGTEGSWAAGTAFTVAWVDPVWSSAANSSPANDATETEVKVGWTPMKGAAYYEVQASTRGGCVWETEATAPPAYGDWVNMPPYVDDRGTEDLDDDITYPAPRSFGQCRLTDKRQLTVNNWLTVDKLFGTEARDNMNSTCWDTGEPTCFRAYLPNSTTIDYGDLGDTVAYKIYWRVRPIYRVTTDTETGWTIGGGGSMEFPGRWLEVSNGFDAGQQNRFSLDNLAAALDVATDGVRCDDPANPSAGNEGCLSAHGARMNAAQDNADPSETPAGYASSEASRSMQMPLFRWSPFPGNFGATSGGYQVQVARDPNFNTIDRIEYVEQLRYYNMGFQQSWVPTYSMPDNSQGTGYYWRVVPCEGWWPNSPPACTGLYYPAAIGSEGGGYTDSAVAQHFPKSSSMNAVVTSSFSGASPLLSWASDLDGDGTISTVEHNTGIESADHFEVEIGSDPFISQDVRALQTTIPRVIPFDSLDGGGNGLQGELPDGLWFWRVRAVDKDGVQGGWSDSSSFTKRTPAPVTTSALSQTGDNVTGAWAAVSGADQYEVEWSTDSTFASVSGTGTTAQTAYKLQAAPGSYYWRVRAQVGGNWGLWSSVSTDGPIAVIQTRSVLKYELSRDVTQISKLVFIDGLLETNGAGDNNEWIQLQRKDTGCNVTYGSYSGVASSTTGEDGEEGTVRFSVKPDRNRCYRMAWSNNGNVLYSAPIPVKTQPGTRVTYSKKTVRRGTKFVVTIRSNASLTGRIRIQYKYKGSWVTIKTITVTNTKLYKMKIGVNRAGRFSTRAYYDRMVTSGGYAAHEITVTNAPKVRVNDLWSFYNRR